MADRILVHHINLPVADAYQYFSDMHKFISIHPVIYKCDLVNENCYKLHERLRIVGIGISFSYNVIIERAEPPKQIVMFAEIMKGVTLKLIFDLCEENGRTILTESVIFNGPFFIRPAFIPFLAKIHLKMIANLNEMKIS